MSANESTVATPAQAADPKSAREWLDALSAGDCDQDTFLRAASRLSQKAPDACWEVLSLLDQYYRRGKIGFELFQRLESHLQSVAVGAEKDGDSGAPLPLAQAPAREAGKNTRIGTSRPRPAAQPPPPADTPPKSVHPPAVGDVLRGRYRLHRVLGTGGTGTLFEAVDLYRIDPTESEQRLAIKVLHTAVTDRPELFAEIHREFQHLQSLSHPNIVRVHEFDRDGGTAFFTMELLSGSLLSHLLRAKHKIPLQRSHAFAIIRGVGDALAHAHAHGVLHGNVSPQNVLITNEGEVRVLDFGAPQAMTPGPWISGFESRPLAHAATPHFASCQLLEGQHPDARDDLYSFACVAYLLLTGDHPFKEHTAVEARTLRLSPRRPAALTGPQWQALRAGLFFDRNRRPSDVEDWLQRLAPHRNVRRLPTLSALMNSVAPPRRLIGAYALAAAGLFALAVIYWATTDDKSPVDAATRLGAQASAALERAGAFIAHEWDEAFNGAEDARGAADTHEAANARDATEHSVANATPPAQPLSEAPPAKAITAAVPAPHTEATIPHSPAPEAFQSPAASASPLRSGNPLARIEFAQDTIEVPPGDSVAQVTVQRKGYLRSDAAFTWWTESGTAVPGTDFVAVSPRVEHFVAGKDHLNLLIPVVLDPKRRRPGNFYVVIDEPGPGASLGGRTLAMVSVLPSERPE
jgi:hypothetical protein